MLNTFFILHLHDKDFKILFFMKKLLLMLLAIPTFAYAQSSDDEKIEIALDTEIDGYRTISTGENRVASNDTYPLDMAIISIKKDGQTQKEYSITFKLQVFTNRLSVKKGQKVLFKKSNGETITLQTNDDIYQHPGYRSRNIYTNIITIGATNQQLQNLIKGNITKIRISTDDTQLIDFEVKDNKFSKTVKSQLDAVEAAFKSNRLYEDF